MLIYIGADHRGFQLKETLKKYLGELGFEFVDVGNEIYDENDDYPDFASAVAQSVSQNPSGSRGILICGSGVGVDIAANKFKGIRSSLVNSPEQAKAARNDDDVNILSLAADFLTEDQAKKILDIWLKTPFSCQEDHQRRLEKINKIET